MTDLGNFDWTQHDEDGASPLVPPGSYLCTVKSFKRVQRGRDTHLDCIVAIVVPISAQGLEPGSTVDGIAWETLPLTDRGLWKVAQYFKAVNAPTTINLNSDADIARVLKLKPFLASVIVDEYKGKSKNKIDTAFQPTAEVQQFMPAIEQAIQRLNGRGRSYDPGEPDAAQSAMGYPQDQPSADFSDDDVPF